MDTVVNNSGKKSILVKFAANDGIDLRAYD